MSSSTLYENFNKKKNLFDSSAYSCFGLIIHSIRMPNSCTNLIGKKTNIHEILNGMDRTQDYENDA